MYLSVLLIYLLIILLDAVPLYKRKQKKESIVYSVISIIALSIIIMQILNIKVPSPSLLIQNIVMVMSGK